MELGTRDEGRGNSKSDVLVLCSLLAPRPSSLFLKGNAAGQHVPVHDPVAGKTIERIRECRRTIVLEEEMADPGEAVTEHRQQPEQDPALADAGQDKHDKDERAADYV